MSSESDNDSLIGGSPRGNSPPSTQVSGVSKVQYAWVVIFTWNVDLEYPFSIVRLTHFKNSNFPWTGITEEMTEEFRLCVRKFSNLPGQEYSVFCKIEHGMNSFF